MGICILSHKEPILSTVDPYGGIKVSTFELTVENDVFSSVITVLFYVVSGSYV